MPNSVLPAPPSLDLIGGERPVALFLDFDGTLVEIAPTPDSIVVPPELAESIAALFDRLEGRLALISGRSLDDLAGHLGDLAVWRAGSHGADCRDPRGGFIGARPEPLPCAVSAALRSFAERTGVSYEAKTHGGALHYRASPELQLEAESYAQSLAADNGLLLKRGKAVVELVYPGTDKGSAVRCFMASPAFAGAFPVFVGDDVTDEDGFSAAISLGGTGVIVGNRDDTVARCSLAGIEEVYAWLNL